MSFAEVLDRLRRAANMRQRGDRQADFATVNRRDLRALVEDFDRLDAIVRSAPPNGLSDDEWAVLQFLQTAPDSAWSFGALARKTGVSQVKVPHVSRSLSARGLAAFCRGLLNDDGEAAGSGYGITHKGAAVVHQWHTRQPLPRCCGGGPQWGHAFDCKTLP